jgi:predicted protein tyrosine phosphatase
MLIDVRSRSEALKFLSEEPWAAISVSTHPDGFPKLNKCQRVDLLQLCFDDIDELDRWAQHPMYHKEYRLFNKQDAMQIWNFLELTKEKIRTLLVHCEAGVSRSPAIAAAINKVLYGTDRGYFTNYTPNMLVYRTLLETHAEMYPNESN